MHYDFFKIEVISSHIPAFSLPPVPRGYVWSERVWACRRGEVLALYRPLNLALCFLKLPALNSNFPGKFINELIKERFLISMGADIDRKEHQELINSARKGGFRFICIFPTNRCVYNCVYCHQKIAKSEGAAFHPKMLMKGLLKCAELCSRTESTIDILIYGGEPLLSFKNCQMVIEESPKLFRQKVRICLTTSGWEIDEHKAEYLSKQNVFVIVSMDGADANQDQYRVAPAGISSYGIAEKAIRILKAKGCRAGISVTIGKHNIGTFNRDLEQLLKKFHPDDIGINAFLHPTDGHNNPYQVDSDEAFSALVAGIETARRMGVYAEQPLRRLRPFALRKPLLKDCSAPGERIVLAPPGVMGFCDSCYPDRKYFHPLEDFVKDESDRDYLVWKGLSSVEMPECQQCPAMTVCGGACRYDAYKHSGRLNGISNNRCAVELKLLNWIIWQTYDLANNDDDVFIPTADLRKRLLGDADLNERNQPFMAGSYQNIDGSVAGSDAG